MTFSLELVQVGCSGGQSKPQAGQEGEKPRRQDFDPTKVPLLDFSSPGPELLFSHLD